uniref:MurNAc alpha-1-phosphate uridylyltransferase n=1 Tax=Candidatus Kentrum sp. FM TaxID=2126340 RepID=A0A450TBE7_9GAMM|nr:MAG: MurNAc alpha-1-phosphate uridylyltransferase [Candidatus Kentron sp. FM]VFJ64628.1 MAG: MurNAc alpha-1-phosphate uridylyltransferase [Candidatus Kentron sp. FM]VFK09038.1 MAG: MurNAc alpha-1-phosphate uridylyltransferase [Candidatus Kentron sp. FM]
MKAMILAAGRGKRMRPLTDRIPKPLLPIAGRSLIVHLIHRLVREGYRDLVINIAYKGNHIETALGNGTAFGARIRYSRESPAALDTGGGILNALPLLGADPFLVINGDIWTDYPFSRLSAPPPPGLAHLVLVPNPPHNAYGDFGLLPEGITALDRDTLPGSGLPAREASRPPHARFRLSNHQGERLTFTGMGVYRPALFSDCEPGKFPLGPILRRAVDAGQVTGERYTGEWQDIGTPARLRLLSSLFEGR